MNAHNKLAGMFGKAGQDKKADKKKKVKYTWQQNVALYLHDMIFMLVIVMAVLMLFLRVIATEGQTVDIDFNEGIVYVDGVALDEPYTKTLTTLREGSDFPQVVEEGNVFVMGDNRNNSKDSRSTQIGQVDKREVLGKVIFLMYPGTGMKGDQARDFDRIGAIA